MTYELIKVRVPYRQVYKKKRGRRLYYSWFEANLDVKIEDIDVDAAPVAYVVRFGSAEKRRDLGYEIRAYDDRLWWPLGGDYNYVLHPETYKRALEEEKNSLEFLKVLDPFFPAYDGRWPLAPFPEERLERVEDELNDLEERRAAANNGAVRTIICGGGVFVSAGEPLFYAMGQGKHLSLEVGVSDDDRHCTRASYAEPGPDRLERKDCARRGFVFGIDELEEAVRSLRARGYSFERTYGIDVRLERHRPQKAASMCARELTGFLFEQSRGEDDRAQGLRAGVPILGNVMLESEAINLRAEVLHQMNSSAHPVVAFNLRQERRAAASIVDRLDAFGLGVSLAPEDEEALSTLATI